MADLTDDQLLAALAEHGTKTAAAAALGMPASTLKGLLARRGIGTSPQRLKAPAKRVTLTRGLVDLAMLPANNCRVKAFRDGLDDEERDALDYALAQDRRDLSASGVRDMLLNAGFGENDVPGVDAINAHRKGERPCRCKG